MAFTPKTAADRLKLRTRGSERPSVATEKTLTSIDEGMAGLRTSRAQLLRVLQRLGMQRNPIGRAGPALCGCVQWRGVGSSHRRAVEVFVKRAFVFFNRCINGSPTKPRQELRKMLLALLAALSSDQDALATLYGAAGGAAWGWKNEG